MKTKNRSRGALRARMLATVCILTCDATAHAQSKSLDSAAPFTMEGCFKTYFPLALKISVKSVPPEVRFYCAAPWDFKLFEAIRGHMKSEGLDVPDVLAGGVAPGKREILRSTSAMARGQAEAGPRGMGAAWHVYHLLPL